MRPQAFARRARPQPGLALPPLCFLVCACLQSRLSPPTTSPPSAAGAAAPALRGPFATEARRAAVGRPLPDPAPFPALPPVRDIEGVSYYVDDHHSVVDPELKRRNQEALRPLRRFVAAVIDRTDGWTVSRPANPAFAIGAAGALASWAGGGALLGAVNRQGEYEREWTLCSLALAYLKVRDAPGLDARQIQSIDAWLAAVARAIQPFYERPGMTSAANNHAYWAGLAVAAAGVAAQDRRLFAWGLARARIGIAQVSPDGLLPLELARRALALHYHLFALAPLVLTAELAQANGVALYDEGDHALQRLAARVIDGLGDPALFAAVAGVAQEIALPPTGADLAWAEPYVARFHDVRLTTWLRAARPLRDDRLGGDLTAAFGVPELAPPGRVP